MIRPEPDDERPLEELSPVKTEKPRASILLAKLPRTGPGPLPKPAAKPVIGARVVGSYVPRVTQKAFEKYGFSAAALLTDWAAIVGADIASYTEPERLRWPKFVDNRATVEADATGRPGATLVLRVSGARALDIQYKSRQLVERINAYFGYRAVAEIRIQQGVVARDDEARSAPMKPQRKPAASSAAAAELETVSDDKLRAALSLLQAGVMAAARR